MIQDHHVFQEKEGYCGVACVQMILSSVDIQQTQEEIASKIYIDWWGTPNQLIIAYLSKYFKIVNYKYGAKFSDISYHLNKGNLIIVNWYDDLDTDGSEGGHYSVVGKLTKQNIELLDPSKARNGIWEINRKDFYKKWYDTITTDDRLWVDSFMIWVDPGPKSLK